MDQAQCEKALQPKYTPLRQQQDCENGLKSEAQPNAGNRLAKNVKITLTILCVTLFMMANAVYMWHPNSNNNYMDQSLDNIQDMLSRLINEGDAHQVKSLISKGSLHLNEIETENSDGSTPIEIAEEYNHGEIVALLLKTTDNRGWNLLHKYAAEGNQSKVKRLLVKDQRYSNGDVSFARTHDGKLPLDLAIDGHQAKVEKQLAASMLEQATKHLRIDRIIETLYSWSRSKTFDVNLQFVDGSTLLHHAANSYGLVKLLVELYGADVCVMDHDGKRPVDESDVQEDVKRFLIIHMKGRC